MGIHEALFDRLSNFGGLTALVGAASAARIYPDEATPDPTAPYVVYFRVGSERHPLMGVDAGVLSSRFQFNTFAVTGDAARAVADQVIVALNRYSGVNASVTIQDIYVENHLDGVDDEAKLKVSVADAIVWYQGT